MLCQRGEGKLGRVFGVGTMAGHPAAGAKHHRAVALDQLAERGVAVRPTFREPSREFPVTEN